jgi:hypothetical protein
MSPDFPVRTRELTQDEFDARLGSQLSDGMVVVDKRVAEAAERGYQQMTRQQRRADLRARAKGDR